MDALKRAERAREAKEGTSPNDEDAAQPAIPELSLNPIDPADRPEIDNSVTSAGFSLEPISDDSRGDTAARAPGIADTGIDLFKLEEDSGAPNAAGDTAIQSLELEFEPGDSQPGAADSGAQALPPIRLREGSSIEDTSATLPSLKAVQASVDSYFDGTDSVSISMDAANPDRLSDTGANTRRGVHVRADSGAFGAVRDESATIAGKRLGEEVDAQRAAQNIFEAKQAHSAGRVGRIAVFVVLPLILAAAAIFGGWYWVEIASSPSVVVRARPAGGLLSPTPPVVAPRLAQSQPTGSAPGQGVQAGVAEPAPTQPVLAQAGGVAEPSHAELVRRAARAALAAGAEANAKQPGANVATDLASNAALAAADLSVKPPEPKIIEAPKPPAPKAAPKPVEPALSDSEFAAALRKAEARLPKPMPEAGAIRIARNKPVRRTSPRLQQAYDAYQRGDFTLARRAYQRVLRAQPTNRDGLLGMAAVASVSGDDSGAAGLYQRLLELNPQDSVARAALFNLGLDPDVGRSVADLKSMLAEEPEAAHLHFSLGNAFAQQERWAEAQDAYFSAVRYDSTNPDYAFNLAVSLDHLRQTQAASQYYRQALELAGGRDVGFRPDAVRQRIAAMGDLGKRL